jgi:RES domain-containing protein
MRKPFEPAFLDQLEAHVKTGWSSQAFRVVLESTPPLRPNSRGGRFNAPDEEALYMSLSEQVCNAEIEAVLSRQPVRITQARKIYLLKVSLSRVLDLSIADELNTFAPHGEDFLGETHAPGQWLGEAAVFIGCGGLLVPSARAEGTNLIVYVNRLEARDVVEVAG